MKWKDGGLQVAVLQESTKNLKDMRKLFESKEDGNW